MPLSKLVLEWLDGGTLTVVRFALAAPLLAFAARKHLRAAFTPRILAAGAIGYGLVIVLQNAGIERTSVSHASLIVGATPALVALTSVAFGRGKCGPVAWLGFALALAGVGIVAGGGGGAASLGGDAHRPALGRDLVDLRRHPAVAAARPRPVRGDRGADDRRRSGRACPTRCSRASRTRPRARRPCSRCSRSPSPGTVGPFALFAYGQSRVAPELAGAFLNLEPLVGTAAGALAFGDPFGPLQLLGGAVILTGHRAHHDARGWWSPHPSSGSPHPRTQGGPLGPAPPRWEPGHMHGDLQIHLAHATQRTRVRRGR